MDLGENSRFIQFLEALRMRNGRNGQNGRNGRNGRNGQNGQFQSGALRLLAFAVTVAFALPLWAGAQETLPAPQMNLQRSKLSIGMYVMDVQMALTPEQREAYDRAFK